MQELTSLSPTAALVNLLLVVHSLGTPRGGGIFFCTTHMHVSSSQGLKQHLL